MGPSAEQMKIKPQKKIKKFKKNQDISKWLNYIPGQSSRIFVVTQKYNIQQKKYQAWKETEKCEAYWEKKSIDWNRPQIDTDDKVSR